MTSAQAAALDRSAADRGIPVIALMERAGEAVARAATAVAGGAYGRRAVVVCGKGNNGGDGFAAARHLARQGMAVTVLALEAVADLRGATEANARRLREVDVAVDRFSPPGAARALARADVAIDAVFGTGFRGVPEDAFADAIDALNDASAPVVAVDIPSGVNGDTGTIDGEAVWARATITFGAEKPGTVLLPGAERAGDVLVAPIGFPVDLLTSSIEVVEAADVARWLPPRPMDTNKRATGVALVVGGSRTMTGAVRLAGTAAYRIGAGLVTVAVPESILLAVQEGLVEATYQPLPQADDGGVDASALDILIERASGVDAVAIGPGMGRGEATAELIRAFVRRSPAPMVIDADALNAFAGRPEDLVERAADAVLTPHAREFSRLSGQGVADIERDRLGSVRGLVERGRAVVLLKGSRTVIGSPDGTTRINVTGTPALSTAGSGDVLTGTITGLLARGLAAEEAAAAGALLHGVAGRLAGARTGEGTVAGDVLLELPTAVSEAMSA